MVADNRFSSFTDSHLLLNTFFFHFDRPSIDVRWVAGVTPSINWYISLDWTNLVKVHPRRRGQETRMNDTTVLLCDVSTFSRKFKIMRQLIIKWWKDDLLIYASGQKFTFLHLVIFGFPLCVLNTFAAFPSVNLWNNSRSNTDYATFLNLKSSSFFKFLCIDFW